MSDLALMQLRQARRLARVGNAAKVIEMLEKASVLASSDPKLQAQVLRELADAYQAMGRDQEASQCRSDADRLEPPAPPPAAPVPSGTLSAPRQLSPRRSSSRGMLVGMFAVIVVGAGIYWTVNRVRHHSARPGIVSAVPGTQGASPGLAQPAPVAVPSVTPPALVNPPAMTSSISTASAPRPVVVSPSVTSIAPALPHPASPTRPVVPIVSIDPDPAPVVLPEPKRSREEILKETVGLCVAVARYEGEVDAGHVKIELPLGSGTAFCVNSSGLILTNRHVVDGPMHEKIPTTIDKTRLPDVLFRGISYVVCFGPDPKDRFVAKLMHRSEQYDLAILKLDRHIDHPLPLARKEVHQGDSILVCGYPGAVMAALNEERNTPAHLAELARKWKTTRRVDAFDDFSADSFSSTLTGGLVSATKRTVDGAEYVQIDATISPGNSGGPVLNNDNEVVGIATWKLRAANPGDAANYNFALRMGQLMEELEPYLKN